MEKTKHHAAVIVQVIDHINAFWELHSERAQFFPAPSPIPRSKIVDFLRRESLAKNDSQVMVHCQIIRALDDAYIDYIVNLENASAKAVAKDDQAAAKEARKTKEKSLARINTRGQRSRPKT